MASGDESDYEYNFQSVEVDGEKQGRQQGESGGIASDISGQISKNVTAYVFEAGKERAKSMWSIYGNIDILRPYFDVEPQQVRLRLLQSLIPKKPVRDIKQRVHAELYGPLMIIFTLIALLLFEMKISDHVVQEGTLMGTAFATCFGYWLGISGLMWVLAYICNTQITLTQLLSLIGYALFGHCVVIFLGTVLHTAHDHAMFYLMWAVLGGLSSLRMIAVLVSRTSGKSQKLIVCSAIAAFHLLFLLYLHFAYHTVVEDLSAVLENSVLPHSKQNLAPANDVKRGLHDDDVVRKLTQKPPFANQQQQLPALSNASKTSSFRKEPKPELVDRLKPAPANPPSNPVAAVKEPDRSVKEPPVHKVNSIQAGYVNASKSENAKNPIPAQNPKVEDVKMVKERLVETSQKKSATLSSSEAKPNQDVLSNM